MLNLKSQKAASNGKAAVLVGEFCGRPVLVRYAPRSIGRPENRDEFIALFNRAALDLGWKADRRGRDGFVKVKSKKG